MQNFKQLHVLSNVTYGGGESILEGVAKRHPNDVLLVLLRKSREFSPANNIINQGLKSKNSYNIFDCGLNVIQSFLMVFMMIHKIPKEAIIVLHGFPLQYSAIFFRLFFPNKINFVYHQVKSLSKVHNKCLAIIEQFILLKSGARIYSVSPFACTAAARYLRIPDSDVHLFVNYYSRLNPDDKKLDAKKLLSKSGSGFKTFICVSRFQKVKGHMRLVQFLSKNKVFSDNSRFFLIGDGPERKVVEEFVQKNGLTNVIFTGAIPRANLSDYYYLADAVLIPSYSESFGVVFLEAIEFKLPTFVFERDLLINPNVFMIDDLINFDFKNYMLPNSIADEILSKYDVEMTFNCVNT